MNLAFDFYNNPVADPVQALRYGQGKKRSVSNVVQPVRELTVRETVRECEGTLCPPAGLIFLAQYMSGIAREIFVPSERGNMLWTESFFLNAGRKTNLEEEVYRLAVRDPNDTVPHTLVDRMKVELTKHNAAIKAAAKLRYS